MKRVKTKHKRGMTLEEQVKFYKAQAEACEKKERDMMALMGACVFAIELLDFNKVLGWGDKRIADRIFSQLMLFEEVTSGRATPIQMVRNAKDLTGVDVMNLFADIVSNTVTPDSIREMIKENKKENIN